MFNYHLNLLKLKNNKDYVWNRVGTNIRTSRIGRKPKFVLDRSAKIHYYIILLYHTRTVKRRERSSDLLNYSVNGCVYTQQFVSNSQLYCIICYTDVIYKHRFVSIRTCKYKSMGYQFTTNLNSCRTMGVSKHEEECKCP